MDEQEFISYCLNKIDNKEKLTEGEISDLLEYEVMKDEGEDRRWSKTITSLIKINDRYFIVDWEQGLTEYQDNSYMDQPIEVFNPESISISSYYTVVYNKEGETKGTFKGTLPKE